MSVDNRLFYGDCLTVLRTLKSESVDLVYLDPPFNSKRDYNAFFSAKEHKDANARILAFEDTWHWGEQAQKEYNALLQNPDAGALGETLLPALRQFLAESDMMAYLVMMGSRIVELRRVLRKTGSLYLHCDPTASHYLKIILDGIFGAKNFRNEISWRRTNAHNDAKQGMKQLGNVRDIIFFYTKSNSWTWNWQYIPYNDEFISKIYNKIDESGRRYCLSDVTAAKGGGDTSYEFHGTYPYKGRFWAYSKENMEKFYKEGKLYFPKNGGTPCYKRYLDEMPGVPIQNDWQDIKPASPGESFGYPTQKPVELLERIIKTSTNEGDIILDPFCGCGTAIHAAEKLKRKWIGIDITHLAIGLIRQRLKKAFPSCRFNEEGTPKDITSARYLAESGGLAGRYQFQYWALFLAGALPAQGKKKGPDSGIDGYIWFYDQLNPKAKPKKIVISVKSGKIPANHIRELAGMLGDPVEIAVLLTLEEPSRKMKADAVAAGNFTYPNGTEVPRIQILTIKDLLDGKRPDFYDYQDGIAMNKQASLEKVEKIKFLDLLE